MIPNLLFIPILASFIATLLSLPYWIKSARRAGLLGTDLNKQLNEKIPESGGVIVVGGFAIGTLIFISLDTFIFNTTENLIEIFALISTIFLISFIAFTDDILGWKIGLKKRTRLVLIAMASIPLIAINAGKSSVSIPFLGHIELGLIYPLFLIPIGIVGAATTFNFLAGFNGLEAGQGVFILSALAIVSYNTGNPWLTIISLIMVAALFAFLLYNFYPAKVFPGDSLTYSVGGLIAIISILGNFEKIAVFFFIPYFLEIALKSRGRLSKQSFGRPKNDGTLELMYNKLYSINHISIFLMQKLNIKPTERKVVFSIWTFQILIIILGFIIFKEGIFI